MLGRHENYKTTKPAKHKVRGIDRNFILRWLSTVFHKIENSRFTLVFLDFYFLMSNKEYRTFIKQRPKGSNLFTKAKQLSLL